MQLRSLLARTPPSYLPATLLLLTALSGLYILLWPSHHHGISELLIHAPLSALRPSESAGPVRWDDWDRIRRHTRPYMEGVVAPLRLRHLEQYHAPEPWREIFVFSAYVDTRPTLVKRPPPHPKEKPELALIVALLGAPFVKWPEMTFPPPPLVCNVVMKRGDETTSFTSPTTMSGLPDPHEGEVQMVSAVFNCPIEGEWEDAEIFVTLSLPSVPPPSDVFVPATYLPVLDGLKHRKGEGSAAVCLSPLLGDLYAPFIADYIAYYQALGFEHFYTYALDPGPETLEALRRVAAADSRVQPIRYALHQGLKYSATYSQDPKRDLRVDPSDWRLPGVELLDGDTEMEMGGLSKGVWDMRMWYFGQSAIQQDCAFRAMKDGHRWVFNGDWDEYLVLKPADGQAWPPPAKSASSTPLVEWFRSVEKLWTWPETLPVGESVKHGVDVAVTTYGMLPASFMFVSAFGCLRCTPLRSQTPSATPAIAEIEAKFPSVDWAKPGSGFPLALVSPVRREAWFQQGFRSKVIVDPWAWWSLGIHHAGLGYADWATTRGFCRAVGPEARKAASTATCARDLLLALGRNTVLVRSFEPSSNVTTPVTSEFGQGGLLHFRGNEKLSLNLVKFNAEAEEERLDVMQDAQSIALIEQQRVDQFQWMTVHDDDGVVVQDWTMLEVMGSALLDVMERKRKWGPVKWFAKGGRKKRRRVAQTGTVGQSSSSSVLRILLGAIWFAFAYLVVRPSIRSSTLGSLGPKSAPDTGEVHQPLFERRASGRRYSH